MTAKINDIQAFIDREADKRAEIQNNSSNPNSSLITAHDARLTRLEVAWMLSHRQTLPELEYMPDGSIIIHHGNNQNHPDAPE